MLIVSPIRWQISTPRHSYMSYAMAIMTNRNKITNQPVFPIPVNMVNNKYSFISYIAVITSFIKNFPCILSIATRHLFIKRFRIPVSNPTRLAAISTTARPRKLIRNNIKNIVASQADTLNFIRSRLRAAQTRAKCLRLRRMFFRNKLYGALGARISYYRFLSKNATAFLPTSYIAGFMTFIYAKLQRANRAAFSYFIHGGILS